MASPGALPNDLSEFVAPLLNISTEGELQQEIKDIIDELSIMIYLQNQQLNVIKSFVNHSKQLLEPKYQPGSPAISPSSPTFSGAQAGASPASPKSPVTSHMRELRTNRNLEWFARISGDLVNSAESRIAELQTLKDSAKSTSDSVSFPLI